MTTWKHRVARIGGNFGVAFFGPLVGSGVAQTYFQSQIVFEEALLVAFIAAALTTGLSVSYELRKYGERQSTTK